jgi:hypothetical protein
MGYRYASGRNSLAICDVCGFQYKLPELRTVIRKGKDTNIKACPECWDPDHPQLKLGETPIYDPQAIRDPRPDNQQLPASRAIIVPVTQVSTNVMAGNVAVSV